MNMSENQLAIIDQNVLTEDERTQLETEIDRIITAHKNNRQTINRMVFECTAALTEAEDDSQKLASKGFFRRLIGGITGSNSRLQNKINSNLRAAQYASQVTLQKLAEQNLMTFELISAVNNKLNSSLEAINDQFKNQYLVMGKFFLRSRNAIVNLEMRMANAERNINLLTWQNSIEYLDFNGTEYASLNDTAKIVCLVRDFYDMTEGKWSTPDLLLLKAAMAQIDLSPRQKVNYFSTMEQIADTPELTEKLLGGKEICPIEDPSYLIPMGTLRKMEDLSGEEKYSVNSISRLLAKHGISETDSAIRNDLVQSYMEQKADVSLDNEVDAFDLILDLLYNLDQANGEHLLADPPKELPALPLQSRSKDDFLTAEESAKSGDGPSLYRLGEYYRRGYGIVSINITKAAQYFSDSCKAGFAPAGCEAAAALPAGSEEQTDLILSVANNVRTLAESGDPAAENALGMMYENGWNVNRSDEEAAAWYRKAAEQKFIPAETNLGKLYSNRDDPDQPFEKAMEWLLKAAEQEDAEAQARLGKMYENGWGTEQSDTKAAEWFSKAAGQGIVEAQVRLGEMYENGTGIEQSDTESAKWFSKAAKQGNIDAQVRLGEMYKNGKGVKQSDTKAAEWFSKAAELGYAPAQTRLGEMYENGKGVERSDIKAAEWFSKAAEQGYAEAQDCLGLMYKNGKGVKQSDTKAAEWFSKAAELDYAPAQYHLGMIHEPYFSQIDEADLKWIQKAAEQGYAPAQCQLGLIYRENTSRTIFSLPVPNDPNLKKAVAWFSKAAEQGYAEAQYHLGKMYDFGWGVKQSKKKANDWFRKAAEQGYEKAQEALEDFNQ